MWRLPKMAVVPYETPQQGPNSRKAHAWRRVESVWGWKEVCKKVGLVARGMNLES